MSWSINKRILSLVGATVVTSALVGCGGSGSTTTGTTVNLSGGLASFAGTSAAGVDASTAPTTVTLSDGTTATLGAGSVAKGGTVGVLPANTAVLAGLFLGSRATGDVTVQKLPLGSVNTVASGIANLTAGVTFSNALALPQGTYRVVLTGPFTATSNGTVLNVSGNLAFTVEVNSAGDTSFPTSMLASLAGNGGNLATAASKVAITVKPAFSGRTFTLGVNNPNGFLTQTITASPSGTFQKFSNTAGAQIPSNGITSVNLDINANL